MIGGMERTRSLLANFGPAGGSCHEYSNNRSCLAPACISEFESYQPATQSVSAVWFPSA